jgi:hypothetical protein
VSDTLSWMLLSENIHVTIDMIHGTDNIKIMVSLYTV